MNLTTFAALLPIGAVGLLSSTSVAADTHKRIVETIDARSFKTVWLEIPVGKMDIEVYDGDKIELDIKLESRRRWFVWRPRNIDAVELEIGTSGSVLVLGIDRDNLEQHWRVRMPAALALDIDVGVGDVRVIDFCNDLNMEVGVGAARVDVAHQNFRSIHVSSGVGDAILRGFQQGNDSERNFVSADAYYYAEGKYRIELGVGVGEAQVSAN
jgi:hypothetical protein